MYLQNFEKKDISSKCFLQWYLLVPFYQKTPREGVIKYLLIPTFRITGNKQKRRISLDIQMSGVLTLYNIAVEDERNVVYKSGGREQERGGSLVYLPNTE